MRVLFLLMMSFSSFSFAAEPATESEGQTQGEANRYGELYVVERNVNLRQSPSLQGKIIRTSKGGEVFFRLSNHHQDNYIRMKDSTGAEFWVYSKLVTPVNAKQ